MKQVLIFDFFGVISAEVAPPWLSKYFNADDAAHIKEGLIVEADRGAISQDALFAELGRRAGMSGPQAEAEWHALAKINTTMVQHLKSLRHKHRVALLSNAPSPLLRHILHKHNLEPLFEQILVSAEEGLAKPNPAIYQLLLSRLGVSVQDALFIDDNPANINSAASIGLKGIVFTPETDLLAEISKA